MPDPLHRPLGVTFTMGMLSTPLPHSIRLRIFTGLALSKRLVHSPALAKGYVFHETEHAPHRIPVVCTARVLCLGMQMLRCGMPEFLDTGTETTFG